MFVGRTTELQILHGLLAQTAASRRPAAAVVIAEPGLGKSRLLAELASAIELPLVRMYGYEPSREIPFSAAAALLRELAHVPNAGERLDAMLFGGAEKGSPIETLRVFEAAFRCLAGTGPLALLVDDLQWVDRESLALFHYLLAGASTDHTRLLLIGASRPAAEAESLWAALAALLAGSTFVGLRLGPLQPEEGVELVVGLAPQVSPAEAQDLWRRAQGSPFWLEALARGGTAEVSPGALLRSRFGGLDADPARVFTLLVAAAQPLQIADTVELLEWPEPRVRGAVVGLVNHALVIQEAGSIRIAHDLLREAAEHQIAEEDSRRLHGRLATWLEATAGDDLDLLSRALEHRQAARLPVGELALRIARLPQRRLLGKPSLETLGLITAKLPDADSVSLQFELASLASELGEWQDALERWELLADRLPSRPQRARAALAAAEAAVRLERADTTYGFADRARSLAPGDPLVAIEADVREGQALRWLQNRVAEAQSRTDSAVGAAEQLVARRGGADALEAPERRAYVAALRADLDAAIRAGDADKVAVRAAEIVGSAQAASEVLTAGFDAIFSLIMFEELAGEAEPRACAALVEARRLVLPIAEVEASHWWGWALHDLGRLNEAEEATRQTAALAERVGAPARFSLAVVRSNALRVQASRGDWRSAVAAIAAQAGSEPDPHYRLNVRMMRLPLLVRYAAPTPADVEPELEAMKADAETAGCDRCWWQNMLLAADARARVGDRVAAEKALAAWDAARPRPRPGPKARRAYLQALIASQDDVAAAIPLFTAAAHSAATAGQHLLQLWIDVDCGSALVTSDSAPRRAQRHAPALARPAAPSSPCPEPPDHPPSAAIRSSSPRHLQRSALRRRERRSWGRSASSSLRDFDCVSLGSGGVPAPRPEWGC